MRGLLLAAVAVGQLFIGSAHAEVSDGVDWSGMSGITCADYLRWDNQAAHQGAQGAMARAMVIAWLGGSLSGVNGERMRLKEDQFTSRDGQDIQARAGEICRKDHTQTIRGVAFQLWIDQAHALDAAR